MFYVLFQKKNAEKIILNLRESNNKKASSFVVAASAVTSAWFFFKFLNTITTARFLCA